MAMPYNVKAASRGGRDAAQKPRKAAVPVACANRRRASESLDDAQTSPAALLLPDGSHKRSLWVPIIETWY